MKRIVALLLTVILVISGIQIPVSAKSDRLTGYEHKEVDFSKLEYEHMDVAKLEAACAKICELCTDEKNLDEVRELFDWLDEEMTKFQTMEMLSLYKFDVHNTDEYWAAEYQYSSSSLQRMLNLSIETMKAIAESPCKEILIDSIGELAVEGLLLTEVADPELQAYLDNAGILASEYMMLIGQGPEVEYGGKLYTAEMLSEEYQAGMLSDEDASAIYMQLLYELPLAAAEIYLQLTDNYNEYAGKLGYDNYLDFAYLASYGRGYDPKDAMVICENIREKLLPYNQHFGAYESGWLQNNAEKRIADDYADILGKCIEKMAPEFKESFDCMMESNAFEVTASEEYPNSNTFYFAEYNMPFVCVKDWPSAKVKTMTDVIHEFGHFNSEYWTAPERVLSIGFDLAETFSQGLELLAAKYYGDIYGDAAESAEKLLLGYLFSAIYNSCLDAELEYTAYTGGYETAEELNAALEEVMLKYYPGGDRIWYGSTKLFQQPGYEISYSVSALNALELYIMSKDDYEAALDSYFTLLADHQELSYNELLKKAGLTAKWTKKALNKFIDSLLKIYIDTDAPVINGVEDEATYSEPVSISVSDASAVYIWLEIDGEDVNMLSRDFELGGSNLPYSLYAVDMFGNETVASFEVEPNLFTITVTENESDEQILSWGKVANTEYYKVYGAPLGQKYKKLGTVKNGETTFVNKKADERIWKYYVVACAKYEGQEIKLSKSVKTFVACSNSKIYTNSKSIEIKDGESLDMNVGNKKKLTVIEELEDASKRRFTSKNVKAVRYYSSDTSVAEVSRKGTITAKGEGVCYIICTTENGLTDKIKVKVG